MKEKELREFSICAVCGKKIGEAKLPLFVTVEITQYAFDTMALRRQAGMEMMMGNVSLAQVMGRNEDLVNNVGDPVKKSICFDCFLEKEIPLPLLLEE